MKRLILTGTLIAIAVILFAQAPQAFNYQAILRNSDGTAKANETVSLQINIVNDQGVSSYLEIHNKTTSEFGLVNLEIGDGVTSDDLSLVDWSSGPYYIEITVNGVVMGSSPLLSVPYALYSNESGDAFSGDYDDLSNRPAISAVGKSGNYSDLIEVPSAFEPTNHTHLESEISNLKHYSDNDIGGDETAFSGWDKDVSNDIAVVDPQKGDVIYYNGNDWQSINIGSDGDFLVIEGGVPVWYTQEREHYLGEIWGGGIIAYVYADSDGTQHGLIASLIDLEIGSNPMIQWSPISEHVPDLSFTDGKSNTELLVSRYGDERYAAKACYDYSYDGFDDWYLPSPSELLIIMNSSWLITTTLENDDDSNSSGFWFDPSFHYWSSKQDDHDSAISFSPYTDIIHTLDSKTSGKRVRAVRKF